jgi:hypothetical protein
MGVSRRNVIRGTFASILATWAAYKVRAQSLRATPSLSKIWGTGNFGGPGGGLAWQIGDVNGDGLDEVIRLNNSGQNMRLGMSLLGWDGATMAMKTLWSTGDIGQGSGAISFRVGDINGDKKTEIIQLWNNGGTLGVIIYGWDGTAMAMKTLWSTGDIGQGPGAVEWQIGDVNGDGCDEIIQLWSNNGRLGVIVYGWDTTAKAIKTLWSTGDIGQGPGAVEWQIGDINGDGRDEIIQLWSNNGRLGVIVYCWDSTARAMTPLWSTRDIGQGAGAIGWRIADVNGDKKAETLQLWDNGGKLGVIVYGWDSTAKAMTTLWSTRDIGQAPGAVGWETNDVNGDGFDEIIQLRSNSGRLGVVIYGWATTVAMKTLWSAGDIGVVFNADSWLVGKVRGKSADLLQLHNANGNTEAVLYGVR